MTELATPEQAPEQVVIRHLDTPWMLAKDAAAHFRVSVEEIYRAGREYETSKGRSGLKVSRRTPYSTFRMHYDDVVHWLDGHPPTRGSRKYPG